jgi:hypothetical protein
VTVMGGSKGEGEDIINIDERVKGGCVDRVKEGVHDSVGYCGDEIPTKRWTGEADVEDRIIGGDNREDEWICKRGGKGEGPVEVCNVRAVEEDELVRAKGRLEWVEVGEGVVGREVRVGRVCKPTIENSSNLGGVIFGLGNDVSSCLQTGRHTTVELHEVHCHVPKCWCEGCGLSRRGNVFGGTGAWGVNVVDEEFGRDGEGANRAKGRPFEGCRVGRWEESMEVGWEGGGGEGQKGLGVGHKGGEGSKMYEKSVEGGEDVVLRCRREFAGEAMREWQDEWACAAKEGFGGRILEGGVRGGLWRKMWEGWSGGVRGIGVVGGGWRR